MQVKSTRRFFAYLIDLFICAVMFYCLSLIVPENVKILLLKEKMSDLNQMVSEQEITWGEYLGEYAETVHQIDVENQGFLMMEWAFGFGYFILLPFLWKGKTIGKFFFHLKVETIKKNHLSLGAIIVRAFLINGMGYLTLSILINLFFSGIFCFGFISFVAILQILLVMIGGIMVLYRKDHLSLHDLITGTRVVSWNPDAREAIPLKVPTA